MRESTVIEGEAKEGEEIELIVKFHCPLSSSG